MESHLPEGSVHRPTVRQRPRWPRSGAATPGASEGAETGQEVFGWGRTSSSSSGVGAGGSKLRLSIVMEHHAEDGDPLVLLSPIEDRLPPLEHSGPRKIRSAAAGEGHL